MPGAYLKDTSRLETLENQLSAPSRAVKDGATPQPEEPLQIVMPTPAVAMGAGVMPPPQAPTTVSVIPPAPAVTLSSAAVATAAGINMIPPPTQHHQQPQFAFNEMSGMTLATLLSHVVINEQVTITT